MGGWELVESDEASLLSSMAVLMNPSSAVTNGPTLRLEPEGVVKVGIQASKGIEWRLDPGPTHLDTCYITGQSFVGAEGKEGGRRLFCTDGF